MAGWLSVSKLWQRQVCSPGSDSSPQIQGNNETTICWGYLSEADTPLLRNETSYLMQGQLKMLRRPSGEFRGRLLLQIKFQSGKLDVYMSDLRIVIVARSRTCERGAI